MLFGKEDIFAIEAKLSQTGYYTFINCCFILKETIIGDILQSSVLAAAKPVWENILKEEGKRNYIAFKNDSTNEIINHLIQIQSEQEDIEFREEHKTRLGKNLRIDINGIESFDGYYIFLIENNGFDRLLCRDNIEERNYEFKLPKNHFYKTIKSLLKWINESTFIALKNDMEV